MNRISAIACLSVVHPPVTSPHEVLLLLKQLEPLTFCPSDGKPQIIFKRCAEQFAPQISIAINLSQIMVRFLICGNGIVIPMSKKLTLIT